MEKIGKVVATPDHKAIVALRRASGCGGNCSACKASCEITDHLVEVDNWIGAVQGDTVRVVFSEQTMLRMSLLVYLVPMFVLVMSIFVTSGIAHLTPALSIFATLLVTFLSFVGISFWARKHRSSIEQSIRIEHI